MIYLLKVLAQRVKLIQSTGKQSLSNQGERTGLMKGFS